MLWWRSIRGIIDEEDAIPKTVLVANYAEIYEQPLNGLPIVVDRDHDADRFHLKTAD